MLLAMCALVAVAPTVPVAHARDKPPIDANVEFRTGLSLLLGDSPDDERSDAIPWLRRAADRGNLSAKFHLADFYWSSVDVSGLHDDRKALQLFLEVARTGDPYAAANVGALFHQRSANSTDLAKARMWYEAAAKGGLSNPAWRIAAMFERGVAGVRRDLVEAYTWLDIADDLAPMATEPQETSAAAQRRDELARQMTAAQIARAQLRARTWLAARPLSGRCDGPPNRIRMVMTVDDGWTTALRAWMDDLERQLISRLTLPPCSRIESRGVMTLRVLRNGEAQPLAAGFPAGLHYFDDAVVAALRQIRPAPLPSGFPSDSVEVRFASFYNETP
jgi:hypothetical protein